MAEPSAHLIERAAERLRETGSLPVPGLVNAPSGTAPSSGAPSGGGSSAGTLATALPPPAWTASRPDLQSVAAPLQTAAPATTAATATATAADADANPVVPGLDPRMLDMPKLERGGMVIGRKSRTRISEEFRIAVGHVLRTLQTSYSSGNGAANLVMVTSARPGEGKSFTALNLAGSLAQQNQREVLLVDVDAKQRPITYELGLTDAPGLLDLVANSALKVEEVLVRTAIPNLSFLPIGSRLPDNSEMLASRPVSTIIERLGRRFANRIIILDAPPCLSTSDPSSLASIVGQTLMVVEAERTQRNELEAALDLIKTCPTITLLLNKIQLTTSYTFGAYHYFGTYS
jgi:receptor protein-tyrosine kinase